MKPALTLTISRDATKEQIEKAIRRVNELKDEFNIAVVVVGGKETRGIEKYIPQPETGGFQGGKWQREKSRNI